MYQPPPPPNPPPGTPANVSYTTTTTTTTSYGGAAPPPLPPPQQQQYAMPVQQFRQGPQQFQVGLFGCCSTPGRCIYLLFCPLCGYASARQAFDDSNWTFNCCCVGPIGIYNFIREGYNIEGGCTSDVLKVLCCLECAGVQIWNEAEKRGKVNKTILKTQGWRAGFINCNMACILSLCFPPCMHASTRTAYDESSWLFNCCCLDQCAIYNLIREGYFIEGDCMSDILYGACCPCFQIGRMDDEVKYRGPIKNYAPLNFQQGVVGGPGVQTMGQR